ncbi:hypothetical protein R6Q59_001834 [Mikania micrantha]|uniref:S-protein homolog n=1 Tax=Mikania micrantha TaxID=192012 RepID=A0A5N6P105_9ASTR|nr:hypothetical protein E3N88_16623 [Mikania micrantha]
MVFMSIKYLHQPQHFTIQGITYKIRVVNGFTNNSSLPLVIWCTSQDGDIGGRALQEGDDYTWYARLSFWAPTPAYSCTLKWDRARIMFAPFKVLKGRTPRSCGTCRKCLWLVKEDGVYFSNDDSKWVKEISWI